jgi:2'-5' RNA ligase
VGERVRLFVALELPEAVREALVTWQEHVLPQGPALRGVPRESLHLTLCFLGGQPASQAGPISVACEAVAAFPAPWISVGQPVWLPRRRPRILALELADSQGVLEELQAALSDRLSAGGWYQPEQRRFLAHVTVARVGRTARLAPGALPISGTLPDPPSAEFAGERVTLYRSRLQPGGARYEALGSVTLRAS